MFDTFSEGDAARDADVVENAPGQADTARSDTARSDTARSDTARSDTSRSDTARSDTSRSDTAQADTARSDTVGNDAGSGSLALLAAAVDAVFAENLSALSQEELLALLKGVEVQSRRLVGVDHRLINEVESRGVARAVTVHSTPVLLSQLLRITPARARARFTAAQDLGPRAGLSGQVLPPLFPTAAAAVAAGAISPEHSRVITRAVDALPEAVAAVHGAAVEAALTDAAREYHPGQLEQIARDLLDHLDPEGSAPTEADHTRRRDLRLWARRDGSGRIDGVLTPLTFARVRAVLDCLATPLPETGGVRDPRTSGQRLHDALDAVCQRLLRSGTLPANGGVAATVVVTMTLDQLQAGTGTARTAHGAPWTSPSSCVTLRRRRSCPPCWTATARSSR